MVCLIHEGSQCSAKLSRQLSSFQPFLLVVLRLYFGWTLAGSGWNKLHNIAGTADYFAGLGIPLPVVSAWSSGGAEWLGGICLALGAFSRPVAAILIGNFLVAYVTAHRVEAWALFTHPHDFVTAPPFLYLLTSALVLVFGPGVFSVDHLLSIWISRRQEKRTAQRPAGEPLEPETARAEAPGQPISRRTSVALVASSLAGVVAGAKLANMARGRETATAAHGSGEPQGGAESGTEVARAATSPATEKDLAALNTFDRDAPAGVMPTLLTEEPHVCCGLNTCKGTSTSGDNACAGQGACATATTHGCQGLNDCKGQGGCGQHPGQNTCEGKGSCAVPLKRPQWELARPLFEKLMPLSGRTVGRAPADCPKTGV